MTTTRMDASVLLEGLTEDQRRAVIHPEGPLLVFAAAGSGKTRVITRRAAYLVLESGVAPWEVLSITFTNKAAGEMRDRVAGLLTPRQAQAMAVSTFHALCARLLRQYFEPAGVKADFVIFDAADQKRAMKQVFKERGVSATHFTPAAVLSQVSRAKNQLIGPDDYAALAGDFFSRKVAELYHDYDRMLRRNNALDFDDLLLRTARLLQGHEPTRTELQQRYRYLQIDEYQDTNHAQFVIAHALAAGHGNLCVVGDPDQSIYGWRGANIGNILDFEQQFPDATVIKLGENYRSTPQILQAADTLIRHNQQRRHKPLYTSNAAGEKPRVLCTADEEHEAQRIVEFFRDHHEAGVSWGEMAVFYRINALSRAVEEQLLHASIPYLVARGTAFYQRKEVKDALAYMRLLANPADEVSLLRIVNTPARGIGEASINRLRGFAEANGVTLWQAMERAGAAEVLSGRAGNAVSRFVKIVHAWQRKVAQSDARALGFTPLVRDVAEMVVRDSGLEDFYRHEKTGDEEKLANLAELVTTAAHFDEQQEAGGSLARRLHEYLESVTLISDADSADPESGAVTLMTLHAAKGLEFPVVAMIGLEEQLLPHARAMDDPAELEEERRLCFVGITRAQRHLLLTHARQRTIRGRREAAIPSPFLRELGEEAVERDDVSAERLAFDGPDHADDYDAAPAGLVRGALVLHKQLGLGRVLSLSPAHAPKRARVHFETGGPKTLVLEHAPLEVVD